MLRVCLFLFLAVASLSTIAAFNPSGRVNNVLLPKPASGRARLSMVAGAASPMRMAAYPNVLKKLPWNVRRDNERNARRIRREAAQLYRELGITEGATFEEITEATELMKARYRDDLKRQIKIDIAKDKIMQLRLEQRMGGMIGETKEARADTYLQRDAREYSKVADKWEPPKWTQGLIVKPNEIWRNNMLICFGGMGIGGLLVPGLAKTFTYLALMAGGGFMGQRGVRDDIDPEDRRMMRGTSTLGAHTVFAFLLAFVLWTISWTVSQYVTKNIPAIAGNTIENSLQNLCVQTVIGLTTAYVQIYKKK